MVRALVVAEKPSIARGIVEMLAKTSHTKRAGRSHFNPIFEFVLPIGGQQCNLSVTSVAGHVKNFDFPAPYSKWQAVAPVMLFSCPVEHRIVEGMENVAETLRAEARFNDWVIVATDNDREGENIGFEIIDICKEGLIDDIVSVFHNAFTANPRIESKRLRFSAVTVSEMKRAFSRLEPPSKNTSDACIVRQQIDLRVGSAFTRFQCLRMQQLFPQVFANQIISYGGCQFPTLGFVVDRYRQRERFIGEDLWKIQVKHSFTRDNDSPLTIEFYWKRVHVFEHLFGQILFDMCMENPQATVDSVTGSHRTKKRPTGLTTTELQKICSTRHHMPASETLDVAENLYQKGIISYPRTETSKYEPSMDLTGLVQEQTQSQSWGAYARQILDRGGPTPFNGTQSDEAHPPIHPTKFVTALDDKQFKVYEVVVRSFLACMSWDAEGNETVITISISAEEFTAKGLMITNRGYLDVYPYDRWSSKEVPRVSVGDTFTPDNLTLEQGETTPPNLLSEVDLLSLMEMNEIGTDATMAEHIKKIQERHYVMLTESRLFTPTNLGIALVDAYDSMQFDISLSKPHLRRELEADMKEIVAGRKSMDMVISAILAKYKQAFIMAQQKANCLDAALAVHFGAPTGQLDNSAQNAEAIQKCPKCKTQNQILKRSHQTGTWMLSCIGYPLCKGAVFLTGAENVTVQPTKCPQCGASELRIKFKPGSAPLHVVDRSNEYQSCISCDETLRELFQGSSAGEGRTATSQPALNSRPEIAPQQRALSQQSQQIPAPAWQFEADMISFIKSFAIRASEIEENGQTPLCHCHRPSSQNTAHTAANEGRQFFRCASEPSCDFFQWADEAPGPNCKCGKPSVRRTTKQGQHQGRDFFACSKKTDGCGYFEWVDGAAGGFSTTTSTTTAQGQDGAGQIVCGCNLPAASRTVSKDGPNKGRQFFCCQKNQQDPTRCGFYLFADARPDTGGGSGTCFACGQSGHFSSECTQQGGRGRGRDSRGSRGGRGASTSRPRTTSSRGRGSRGRGRGKQQHETFDE